MVKSSPHSSCTDDTISCSLDSWIYMWSFPAQAFLPHFLSVFIKVLWELGIREGHTKVVLFPEPLAVTDSWLAGVAEVKTGTGWMNLDRTVCLSKDSSLKTKWRWLECSTLDSPLLHLARGLSDIFFWLRLRFTMRFMMSVKYILYNAW